MARISTYNQDDSLNKLDKVLGTDSATGSTKNYTIESIAETANEFGLVEVFDGAHYTYQDYVAPESYPTGVINLNEGVATAANFSAISVLYISTDDATDNFLGDYLDQMNEDFIKINKRNDINSFGIYKVLTNTTPNPQYRKFTLQHQASAGVLNPSDKLFLSNYSAKFDLILNQHSATELQDINSSGSGSIITTNERNNLTDLTNNALLHADVVDALDNTTADIPLSANQGKVLKDLIDSINTLLTSDNVDLDTLQEVVDYIETNRTSLETLGIGNITGLQNALNLKQNTEAGKGLSANDFTNAHVSKLAGIEAAAEVNVQADWDNNNPSNDAYINNKPTGLLTNTSTDASIALNVTSMADVSSAGSGAIITDAERSKITSITSVGSGAIITSNERSKINNLDVNSTNRTVTDGVDSIVVPPANAEVNVQANWNESDSASDAFIQNKPTLAPSNAEANVQANWNETDTNNDAFILNKPDLSAKVDTTRTITVQGTANEIEVAPNTAQDLSADRTVTIGLPNDVNVAGDLTVGETIELSNAQATTPTFDNGIYYSTENGHDTLHFRYHGHDLSIDYITEVLATGILNGGELTKANNTQFTIAAGDGIINNLNKAANSDPHPELTKVEWTQQTITVDGLDANDTTQLNSWIYVDSTGTVQQQSYSFTDAQKRTNIIIGSAIHSEGVLKFVKTFPITAYSSSSQLTEFANLFGALKKSGHNITANGANLSIDRAAGVSFAIGRNYVTDPENPSTVSDSSRSICAIHRYYRDGSNGFVLDDGTSGGGYTELDPGKYDDGTGTLATVSGGHYSVQRLYYFPGTPSIVVAYYGHDSYASMDDAEKNYIYEDFLEAENTADQAIYLGAIILKGSATALNDSAQAKILTAGTFRGLASVNIGGVSADASLGDLQDVDVTGVTNGQFLQYDSSQAEWVPGDSSVAPLTLDITNNRVGLNNTTPVETLDVTGTVKSSGALTVASGGADITGNVAVTGDVTGTNLNISNWNAAYNYGDHSAAGYLTAHPNIAAATSSDNTGRVYIQDISLDSNGHVTAIQTAEETLVNTDTTYTAGAGIALNGTEFSADISTIVDPLTLNTVTNKVGLNNATPAVSLDVGGTDAIKVPVGTTADRSGFTAAAGMIRFNTTESEFEGYTGSYWAPMRNYDYTPLVITKNASNQFPITFADAVNFQLNAAGTWTIDPTVASSDVGKSGIIIISNTGTTAPGALPTVFKTPNGDSVVFETDSGDTSILSYLVVSTSIVLVNYVGNFG